MTNKENTTTSRSVPRIFEILEVMARHPGGLTLMNILEKLNHPPKSSVYILLKQLVQLKYITYLEAEKLYTVGSGLVRLSSMVMAEHTIQKHARPSLEKLSKLSGEDTYLGIVHEDGLYYIDKVEGDVSVRLNISIGAKRHLHSSCIGKLMVAYMDEHEQEQIVKRSGMPKVAKNTITDWPAFRDELKRIREKGFSVTDEESIDGVIGIAAPIRNHHSEVIAGICISAPSGRVNARKQELIAMVVSAAEEISEQLGHEW